MPFRSLLLVLVLVFARPQPAFAQSAATPSAAVPAQVLMLGVFHFANPGLDAVKYTPIDVMRPESQAWLERFAQRLARFAPTKVVLEYGDAEDEAVNRRYAEFAAGRFELPRNEVYQLGFRVARLAGLPRVHGFDTDAPPRKIELWGALDRHPEAAARLATLIETESRRLDREHSTGTLGEILARLNTEAEDRRNKGFYMLLNDVGARQRTFLGADASADWWERNLRMYAILQSLAAPGERVLVVVGAGHAAVLRDFLRADGERAEVNVAGYF